MDDKLLKRRLDKFGKQPVEEMSSTTRKYFKKAGHRKQEIVSYEAKK